jgi:hypothetical protein
MIKTTAILLFWTLSLSLYASIDHKKAIQTLLEKIENSEALFERNGQVHQAPDAKNHLERKWRQARRFNFRKEEITAEQFIEKIASRSSMSGKDYFIILPSGQRLTMSEWFKLIQAENLSSNAKEI